MINLDISFVIQIVNFLVLMAVLNFVLYRPIRRVLAERAGQIEGARAKTAAVDQEVQAKLAEYESHLRGVKSAAGDERATLRNEAQAEAAGILEKARTEATGHLSAIKEQVAKEATDARALLKQQAEALSGEICEKVLGRSL